jgi:hypothetical protein
MIQTLALIRPEDVGDRRVISREDTDAGLLWDHGDIDLGCGGCGFTLAAHIGALASLDGLVLQCPDCDRLNVTS